MGQLEYDLYDERGNRKYLTVEKRQRFFDDIERALPKTMDRGKQTFALLLYLYLVLALTKAWPPHTSISIFLPVRSFSKH